jgi:peptidoglycan/LPS O-acetylase OafA/YrhL
LLVGCTLALLLSRPSVRAFILKNFPKETPLLGAILLFILQQRTYGYVTLTGNLLIAVMLGSTLVVHEGLAFQWLNSRLLVALGTISYSLYVWQQLFLQHPFGVLPLGALSSFPWNVACAVTVAACSYYGIERPAVRLGKRLMRRHAPTSDEAAVQVPA